MLSYKHVQPELSLEKGAFPEGELRHGYISGNTFSVLKVEYRPVRTPGGALLAILEGDIVLGTVEELETTRKAIEGISPNIPSRERGSLPPVSDAGVAAVTRIAQADATVILEVSGLTGGTASGGALSDAPAAAGRPAGAAAGIGIAGTRFRWPGRIVPYVIDESLPDPARVRDAMSHWEARTQIRFLERTAQSDYVRFVDEGGCWSHVGRRGGEQQLSLGEGCSVGNAIHEIGHAVGLWHEHSRSDRDAHVAIVWANIDQQYLDNFLQHVNDGTDLGDYDYGSVMHYPATAFTTNGQPTIVPKRSGVLIGQREGLSEGDIQAVAKMYISV